MTRKNEQLITGNYYAEPSGAALPYPTGFALPSPLHVLGCACHGDSRTPFISARYAGSVRIE
jgi:hypothetical protein